MTSFTKPVSAATIYILFELYKYQPAIIKLGQHKAVLIFQLYTMVLDRFIDNIFSI
jgi:hypothetical protein